MVRTGGEMATVVEPSIWSKAPAARSAVIPFTVAAVLAVNLSIYFVG
jgi:hypothetical protein